MPTKPRQRKGEDVAYTRLTRNILLENLVCPKVFDKFHEDARNGSIIGIAGDDFAVVGVDARHVDESNQALHRITNRLTLATTGDQCCSAHLVSTLRARMFMNEYMRKREIPSQCVAMLLSCLLTNQCCSESCNLNHNSTMLAGLDHEGKGAIYAYNPLGYHERVRYRAMGAASAVLQPILMDALAPPPPSSQSTSESESETSSSQSFDIAKKRKTRQSELWLSKTPKVDAHSTKITFDQAFDLIVCAFKKALQCGNVYVGDVLVITAHTKDGCYTHEVILRSPRKSLECWI